MFEKCLFEKCSFEKKLGKNAFISNAYKTNLILKNAFNQKIHLIKMQIFENVYLKKKKCFLNMLI